MKEKFDDITVDKTNGHEWSQICKTCVQEHNLTKYVNPESKGYGNGICGVTGCNNEADYYIDFPDNSKETITIS